MPTYFAEIPGYELAKAEIEAPSTKKARTTFLRYLHSRGYIEHDAKSDFREDILVRQMTPGQFPVTVKLQYGGGVEEVGKPISLGPMPVPEPEEEIPEEVRYPEPERVPVAPFTTEPSPELNGDEEWGEPDEGWPRMGEMREWTRPLPVSTGSPIMDLSKRTRGM